MMDSVTAKSHGRFVRVLGPFLESPGNFSGPKSNIHIEIKRIRARVLARKLLHFVDQFIFLGNLARFLITVPVLLDRVRH